ncbi:hypothetical protein BDW22DRAFT_905145 [Trametopsis cervina]|nr:hypothetical protein BDW22DRAFT_905145 [Trametopsis cervina]
MAQPTEDRSYLNASELGRSLYVITSYPELTEQMDTWYEELLPNGNALNRKLEEVHRMTRENETIAAL